MADALTLTPLALSDARFNVLTNTDLLKLIFDNLDAQSLCAVEAVCKLWRGSTQTTWKALLASRWPNSVEAQEYLRTQHPTNADISKQTYQLHAKAGKKAAFSFKVEMWHGDDPDVRVPLILKTFHGAQALPYDTRFERGLGARFGIRFKCDPDSNHALDAVDLFAEAPKRTIELSLTVMYACEVADRDVRAVLQKVCTFNAYGRLSARYAERFVTDPIVSRTRLTMQPHRSPQGVWQMTIDISGLSGMDTDTMLNLLAGDMACDVTGRLP